MLQRCKFELRKRFNKDFECHSIPVRHHHKTESAQEQGWTDYQQRKDSLEILHLLSHKGLSQKMNNRMFLLLVLAPDNYEEEEKEKRKINYRKIVTEKKRKKNRVEGNKKEGKQGKEK